MVRQARLVETDAVFHITARGNYRQTVFFSDQDRAEYLELLGRHATLEGLEIFGWCLMTVLRYIELNPVRAELVAKAEQERIGTSGELPELPGRRDMAAMFLVRYHHFVALDRLRRRV
ncbi:MAG: hypothetical protein WBW33_01680 [Bryobacteraceae bacterium]